ncbi:MAG: hypothetical protein MJK12_03465 [Colwellia sp.]|nr:hypothetical protein [Colwellia sp.]
MQYITKYKVIFFLLILLSLLISIIQFPPISQSISANVDDTTSVIANKGNTTEAIGDNKIPTLVKNEEKSVDEDCKENSKLAGSQQSLEYNVEDYSEKYFILKIQQSSNKEEQLVRHLLLPLSENKEVSQQTAESNFLQLMAYSKEFPEQKLVYAELLFVCSANKGLAGCNDIERQAIAFDDQNGATWEKIAIIRLSKQDYEGTLIALENAGSSSFYDEYSTEYIAAIEQALLSSGSVSNYNHAVVVSNGFGAGRSQIASDPLRSYCRNNSEQSSELFNTCLAFAKNMQRGKDPFIVGMALSFQQQLYQAIGDVENTEYMQLQIDKHHNNNSLTAELFKLLKESSPLLISEYIKASTSEINESAITELKKSYALNPCIKSPSKV